MDNRDTSNKAYASVVLNIPLEKSFEYEVPLAMREQICVGKLVRVPFGKREVNGCVVELKAQKSFPYQVKPIKAIISPDFVLEPSMLKLAQWLAQRYYCSPGEALHCVSFIGFNDVSAKEEKALILNVSSDELKAQQLTPKQQQIIDYFLEIKNEPTPASIISQDLQVGRGVIKKLIEKKILAEVVRKIERKDEYKTYQVKGGEALPLTPDQQSAYDSIVPYLKEKRGGIFLLFGVTGSGKTEVYLQLIAEALKMGRGAIVLVPEISLTPQTVDRFRSRFGDLVGVYHSRMTLGQKYDLWQRIKRETVKVIVGARSAIFSPLPQLGVIVIDEEQEGTYKQETAPRYHTRDVAEKRAAVENAVVILGSATPSIESYYYATQGKYQLLRLPERIHKLPLPEIELIDMGKEIRSKRKYFLISERLIKAIKDSLNKQEQVILLLNRRGYANFLLCHSCRQPVKCNRCDVTLTYHKSENKLICHYCNAKQSVPTQCPGCGSIHISLMGMGTQRIEEELLKIFSNHRILRLDLDTTHSRFEFIKKWEEIVNGSAEIILGTQMVAKGFDLERVTLVGVISADMSLFLPDFRAGERTFSLLTQASGRAGRSWRGGKVIIQTFMPNYYAINLATRHDYETFARRELAIRRQMQFPPFFRLINIVFASPREERVREQIEKLANLLKVSIYKPEFQEMGIIGPAPAVIKRIKGKYRWQVLIRGTDPELMLALLKQALHDYYQLRPRRQVDITIDIDPLDIM